MKFKNKFEHFIYIFGLLFAALNMSASAQSAQLEPTPTIISDSAADINFNLQLARKYLLGDGVQKDISKAEDFYNQVSHDGKAIGFFPGSASNEIGNIHLSNYKDSKNPKDFEIALDWFSKAEEQGFDSASYVSKCYQNGTDGFPKDLSKAILWLEKSIKCDHQLGNLSRISLAKIYLNNDENIKYLSKAQTLLNDVLSSDESTGKVEASQLLLKIDGYQIIAASEGDFKNEHIVLPSFYIWRRVYQKDGKSPYEQYLIKPNGSLIRSRGVDDNYDNWWSKKIGDLSREANNNKNEATTFLSPSSKWQIIPNLEDEGADLLKLFIKTQSEAEFEPITIPINEWYQPIAWNPKKDLFYYWTSGGADTGRQNTYYQFDPENKVFSLIGDGSYYLEFSPDGKWVIWISGCAMDYIDRQIVVYNVETNKNYCLTNGHSDNRFITWFKNQ